MSLAKELEDRVLIVSIAPTLPRTRLEAPGAHRRVDMFIQRLRFAPLSITNPRAFPKNNLTIFDPVPAAEPCECHKLREKHYNYKKGRCTFPDLKCDTCKALADIDAKRLAEELTALYATLTSRPHSASASFLSLPALHADFARDTRKPSLVYRRI